MKEIKQEDITLEASLLKAMAVKANYNKFIACVDVKRLIPITAQLIKDYKKYYDKYNADIDWDVFYTEFSMHWHKRDLDSADLAYYRETVFPLVKNSQVSNDILIALLEREASTKIDNILENGFNEAAINEIIRELLNQKSAYSNQLDTDVFRVQDVDLSILDTSKGIEWFLPKLQAGLGSIMGGQFIIVAADSNIGKGAFCMSQCVHTFKNLNKINSNRPIMYFTSEDTEPDLVGRFLSNLYKDNVPGGFESIIATESKVKEHYLKNYNADLFLGKQIRGPSDLHIIENKIAKHNPSLIIIDMVDKMSKSTHIDDLTPLYQNIRSLANDGYPILGTSQSGNTSWFNQKTGTTQTIRHLTDKHLAGSKSGKQGAAYCMIMIGKDDAIPNVRYVDTTKKKRGHNVSVTCEIIEKFSLYKEIL